VVRVAGGLKLIKANLVCEGIDSL